MKVKKKRWKRQHLRSAEHKRKTDSCSLPSWHISYIYRAKEKDKWERNPARRLLLSSPTPSHLPLSASSILPAVPSTCTADNLIFNFLFFLPRDIFIYAWCGGFSAPFVPRARPPLVIYLLNKWFTYPSPGNPMLGDADFSSRFG
jgi:hypothetical protein